MLRWQIHGSSRYRNSKIAGNYLALSWFVQGEQCSNRDAVEMGEERVSVGPLDSFGYFHM